MFPWELKCWRFCPSVAHLGGSGTFKGWYPEGGLLVIEVSAFERTVRSWSSPRHHHLTSPTEDWKGWSACSLTWRNSNSELAQPFSLCKLMLSDVCLFVFILIENKPVGTFLRCFLSYEIVTWLYWEHLMFQWRLNNFQLEFFSPSSLPHEQQEAEPPKGREMLFSKE